jgi:hypothetical protein
MVVTPPEILLLLGTPYSTEFTILAVLLGQIVAVGTIFVAVPGVVVATASIVVSPLVPVSVVGSRRHGGEQSCTQCECTQYQESLHNYRISTLKSVSSGCEWRHMKYCRCSLFFVR